MKKIVVLDGYALNPGDLSWKAFESLGELTIYSRTSLTDTNEIVSRIGTAEIALTNKTPLNADVIAAAPNLTYIGVLATGYNNIDCQTAKNKNITVTNVPAYSTDAVAQFTFALLLETVSHVGTHNQAVHAGEWQESGDFSFRKQPLMELAGKTLGLIGCGQIAQATAKIAMAFGMKVIYYNHRSKRALTGMHQCSLHEVYQQSDVLSLHIPQTRDTTGFISAEALQMMKPGAILVNTARGGLIDEEAVAKALMSGKLRAFAADVAINEPISVNSPLLLSPNCYLTPHIAWAPVETRQRLMGIAYENLICYINGNPQNVVNEMVCR